MNCSPKTKKSTTKRSPNEPIKGCSNNSETIGILARCCSRNISNKCYFLALRLFNRALNKMQHQQFTDFAFLTIFYCREICKCTYTCDELTGSQLSWSSIFLGARPQSPCYFEGGDKSPPSKPKFKQHLTTSFRWASHDVTHGVDIFLHLEFRSSWTSCNIWVAFEEHLSRYLCNFKATVNSIFFAL